MTVSHFSLYLLPPILKIRFSKPWIQFLEVKYFQVLSLNMQIRMLICFEFPHYFLLKINVEAFETYEKERN
jgi:hypothetical protein